MRVSFFFLSYNYGCQFFYAYIPHTPRNRTQEKGKKGKDNRHNSTSQTESERNPCCLVKGDQPETHTHTHTHRVLTLVRFVCAWWLSATGQRTAYLRFSRLRLRPGETSLRVIAYLFANTKPRKTQGARVVFCICKKRRQTPIHDAVLMHADNLTAQRFVKLHDDDPPPNTFHGLTNQVSRRANRRPMLFTQRAPNMF